MSTPGAATSGFSRSEIVVGPTDEKSAWVARGVVPLISTAPTVIARSEFAGDEIDPAPKSLKSFPAATTETTPARAAASRARATMSRRGSSSGSPIERLSTSMPSRTAASMAATISGAFPFGLSPESVPHERLVVADERAWRDARHRAPGGLRASVPGRDPGDVGAVRGVVAIEGKRCILGPRSGRRESARGDHLRVREPLLALRKSGRHRVAGRVEERVAVIHAGVDHADLDALSRGLETCAPEPRCADLLWAAVELRHVPRGGEHVADSGNAAEQRHLCAREIDGEAVRDEPIAPPDPCIRQRSRDRAPECALLVRNPCLGARSMRERGRGQRDHDLRPALRTRDRAGLATLFTSLSSAGARCRRERGRRERGRERGRGGSSRDETSRS